jgi:toxin ParE1/3/4
VKRVTIRPSADRDLDEIFDWIARDDVDAAERQVRRLIAATLAFRDYPERGRARPEIGEGMRSLVNGRYLTSTASLMM